ncbi:MAG: patatin-like phospholipase family protein [Eubacteriaceae bacterium]|nr:patatin-like phospholipase family protein [Eubacteriaceae bacterium]
MLGIVLEGGGGKGAYQMGAWKALRELNIQYHGVVGTSVGALNAAIMVQGDYEPAYDLWRNMNPLKVLNEDEGLIERIMSYSFTAEDIEGYKKELRDVFGIEGLDITPFKEMLDRMVDESRIRKSPKDFGLVTIDVDKNQGLEVFKEDIPMGLLKDYLIASSFLPVFKEERLHGKIYLDGGFYNNLPTRMLVSKGYKDLIVIRLNNRELQFPVDESCLNIIKIIPGEDLGSAMDFTNEHVNYNMELGYKDAMKVLG